MTPSVTLPVPEPLMPDFGGTRIKTFSELDKGSLAHIKELCLSVSLSRIQTLVKLVCVRMERGGEQYSSPPSF